MRIRGGLTFPGDKSISHRALMVAALTDGDCTINNLSTGADVESTRQCLSSCGIPSTTRGGRMSITGGKMKPPSQPLDCGNSGTAVRLLMGLLQGRGITATFEGDASLSRRPMDRIIQPLEMMGASILSVNNHLPIEIRAGLLRGIEYHPPVASAQVKSAILFAGLGADGQTTVVEKMPTRNHTEIMLANLGANIEVNGNHITVHQLERPLESFHLLVPGDPSTASFFAAAAALVDGSDLVLRRVLANPTRSGFFTVLHKMGTGIEHLNTYEERGEPVCDLRISYRPLTAVSVSRGEIPGIIDELPILAILATQAEGTTEVRDASELRVKESDRIQAICSNLRRMGANITELEDGFVIKGPTPLRGCRIATFGDHRIAMAFTVAGLIADGTLRLDNPRCIGVSCPEFNDLLRRVVH